VLKVFSEDLFLSNEQEGRVMKNWWIHRKRKRGTKKISHRTLFLLEEREKPCLCYTRREKGRFSRIGTESLVRSPPASPIF